MRIILIRLAPVLKSYKGNETISEVTDKISGVIFLEDTSIESTDTASLNVKGFAYLNPNAKNKVSRQFKDYLLRLGLAVDDFGHDNY